MTEWNDESHDLLDDLIRRLEEAWRSGGEVDLAQFVPTADHPLRNEALVALIKVDQELRWQHDNDKTLRRIPGRVARTASAQRADRGIAGRRRRTAGRNRHVSIGSRRGGGYARILCRPTSRGRSTFAARTATTGWRLSSKHRLRM